MFFSGLNLRQHLFFTSAFHWYDNSSESADFKDRFGVSGSTTEQCIVPKNEIGVSCKGRVDWYPAGQQSRCRPASIPYLGKRPLFY